MLPGGLKNVSNAVHEHNFALYSRVPNKRNGWNKHDGWNFHSKSINMMVLINVMVGNSLKMFVFLPGKYEKFRKK